MDENEQLQWTKCTNDEGFIKIGENNIYSIFVSEKTDIQHYDIILDYWKYNNDFKAFVNYDINEVSKKHGIKSDLFNAITCFKSYVRLKNLKCIDCGNNYMGERFYSKFVFIGLMTKKTICPSCNESNEISKEDKINQIKENHVNFMKEEKYNTMSEIDVSFIIELCNNNNNIDYVAKKLGLNEYATRDIINRLKLCGFYDYGYDEKNKEDGLVLDDILIKMFKKEETKTKSIFNSPRSLEFYNLIKQFYPYVYPEISLKTIATKHQIGSKFLNNSFSRQYYWNCIFDITITDQDGFPKIIIEYNGSYHSSLDQKQKGIFKTEVLKHLGIKYKVFNSSTNFNTEIDKIKILCGKQSKETT